MSTENTRSRQATRGIVGAAPGTRPPAPRSRLLAIVYGISLSLLLTLGGGLAILASAHVSSSAITASASADRALGQALVGALGSSVVDESLSPAAVRRMTRVLERAVDDVGLMGIALVAPDGRVRVSAGAPFDPPAGRPTRIGAADAGAQLVMTSGGPRLYESFPVTHDGRVETILQILRDGAPVLAAAEAAQRDIGLGMAGGATVLVVVLFLVFRGAQRRLDHQTGQLLESTRRDPLTGVLTHGAALAVLSEAVAELDTRPVSVAMVDIDNFRQLNDTHGHDLGDAVVRAVAAVLDGDDGPIRVGRGGPDEFLVVGPDVDAQAMATRMEDARRRLAVSGITAGDGARLGLTLSVGIAVAPLHGRTVVEVLSAAGMTLGEAKSGGGDQVLIARLSYVELVEEHRASFSILDGLVQAIDTRDRYTRRHSQDVARYALFLARQLGLDDAETRALHQAALLHDVGKIAVPDAILRKPGSLTADELEVMKEHVLLGGLLVRDLANATQVADGVRHHHERWDGAGYPDGLEGEAIPLIARIIAVADTYSAMTTSRPYRRALSPAAALGRLSRAADSQLDPRLVDVFVLAMESSPEPPMPSDARTPSAWLGEETAA